MTRHTPIETTTPKARLFLILIFLGVFLGAFGYATFTADRIETDTRLQVEAAIPVRDMGWVVSDVDGMRVFLSGEAPDEQGVFRVSEAIASKVNLSNIENHLQAPAAAKTVSEVQIEIVQNEKISSIIGLLPAEPSPVPLYRALERAKPTLTTLNLVEGIEGEMDAQWANEMNFIAEIVNLVDNVKISAVPGKVMVEAVSRTQEDADLLRSELNALAPSDTKLLLDISSPRPLITPFAFELVQDPDGVRVESCAITDPNQIEKFGAQRPDALDDFTQDCQLGIGAPTDNWGGFIEQALIDTGDLSEYELRVKDNQVRLVYPATEDPKLIEATLSQIRGGLPPGFGFESEARIKVKTIAEIEAEGQGALLRIVKSDTGEVVISGVMGSEAMLQNIESFAIAKLGAETKFNNIEIVEDLPSNWEENAFSIVEVMSGLSHGEVVMADGNIELSGVVNSDEIRDGLVTFMESEVQETNIEFNMTVEESAIPIARIDPNLCVERINIALIETPIQFETSSAKIASGSDEQIEAISNILSECRGYNFEIAGHTDSQGAETFNLNLSQSRANSVLEAILLTGLNVGSLSAKGYGESEPVASNETDDGRAKNRRIEVRLTAESGE